MTNSPQLSLPLEEFLARQAPGIARHRRIFCNRNLRMGGIAWVGFDMDYTLAIYDQQQMDELSIRATIEKLVARGYPEFIADDSVRDRVPGARPAHRQAIRAHPEDEPLQVRHARGTTASASSARTSSASCTTRRRSARRRPRYHWIDTLYALSEAARLRGDRRRVRAARAGHRLRARVHRHSREHRRGPPRRDDPRDGRGRPAAFRREGPRSRAHAAQAAKRRQEALSADELALVVHRQDDVVPARRRDERVPALAQLLRRRHRRRDQARVLPRAAAAHGPRGRPARAGCGSCSSAARSTRAATCTTSSARSAPRATRSSTSATTSTATSCGARKRAPGGPR